MAINWFDKNQTTAKFQSILLSQGSMDDFMVNVGGHSIPPNNTLKMLGITLDDRLNFQTHLSNICHKAYRQINALKCISKLYKAQCRMHVYKSFVFTNFNFPLICSVVKPTQED